MTKVTIDALTPREREILTLIAEGDSLAEIAQKLSRSLKTIESHRLSIGRKLKAGNRVELAKIAISQGLVQLETEPYNTPNSGQALSLKWISEINQMIQQATGREMLERFCKAASMLPGVAIAAICTSDQTIGSGTCDIYSRVIMAVSDRGQLTKPVRYNAMQTPCEKIIENGSVMMAKGIRDSFPNDLWLAQVEAEGYLGLMLNNTKGVSVGGVGLVSRAKLDNIDVLREVVAFFAPRLAGAIEVCVQIEALRSENDRLHADLASPALDMLTPAEATDSNALSRSFQNIHRRVHQLAGTAFLSEFVNTICAEFGVYGAGICSLDHSLTSKTLQSVAFSLNHAQQDPIRYEIQGTPCDSTLTEGFFHFNDYAAHGFNNDDEFIREHGIQSYCGNRLPSPAGETAGVIWVIDQSPIENTESIRNIMQYYAPRIGAELANFTQFEMLMQERERLEKQLAKKSKPRTKTPA
ncbi:MAG: LuxR C-terminal-related transcriptional regulator [Phycisphaeraceae bacterium]|nr:LuxR C-terminal-related transcriptional regulator [Phycisphaeraceae bacterium]